MNTDITAMAKPEYPVVDRNPPFTKTVANFNFLDYCRLLTITGVSVTVGYLSGIKPNIRGPSMVTGGLIGVMGGFMYAYQNSAGRLMGFFPNEEEVARFNGNDIDKSKHLLSFHLHFPHLHLLHHSKKESRDIPKGCLAIIVGQGEEQQRFVVPVIYFNHPLFMQLLKVAEEEYGFEQKGTITIPCHVAQFRYVQGIIDKEQTHHQHHHHHVGCFRAS